MTRPPLPLGSHGKIAVWEEGKTFIARTKFRDLDGVVRPVKRSGKSRAAAERALKAALVERRTPIAGVRVAPDTRVSKMAELWFEEVVVSQIMAVAAWRGAITTNPVREVGRIDGAPKRKPRSLTAEEWLA